MCNTKALKKDVDSITKGKLTIESNTAITSSRENFTLKLRARTDLNPYVVPGIYFDCAGTYRACLYMDSKGNLRFRDDDGREAIVASPK